MYFSTPYYLNWKDLMVQYFTDELFEIVFIEEEDYTFSTTETYLIQSRYHPEFKLELILECHGIDYPLLRSLRQISSNLSQTQALSSKYFNLRFNEFNNKYIILLLERVYTQNLRRQLLTRIDPNRLN